MPWDLILTVGIKLFDWFYSRGKRAQEAKKDFIAFVESKKFTAQNLSRMVTDEEHMELELKKKLEKK